MHYFMKLFSIAIIGMAPSAWADGVGEQGSIDLVRDAKAFKSLTDRILKHQIPKKIDLSLKENSKKAALPYQEEIELASNRFKISMPLIAAVIKCESNWDPHAKSRKGAQGLMQVLPSTAEGILKGVSPYLWDPKVNIYVGTAYLRTLANRYDGDAGKVISGYNVGPTWVSSGRSLPRETRRYRVCVSRWFQHYYKQL